MADSVNTWNAEAQYLKGLSKDVSNDQEYLDSLAQSTLNPFKTKENIREGINTLQAQKYNSAEAQLNRDWQTAMSNSAHQREVADLQAAGLNTWLGADGSGASTPTGGAAHSAAAHSSPDQIHPMGTLMQVLQIAAMFKGIGANETRAAASMLSATANQEKAKAASMSAEKGLTAETKKELANKKLEIQEKEIQSRIAKRVSDDMAKQNDHALNKMNFDLKQDKFLFDSAMKNKISNRDDLLASAKLLDRLGDSTSKRYFYDAKGKKLASQEIEKLGMDANDFASMLELVKNKKKK